MKKINLIVVMFFLFFTQLAFPQSNNPAPYCLPTCSHTPCSENGPSNWAGNWSNDFINSFSTTGGVVDISNNNSGCCGLPNNYIYYCNTYLQVNAGQTLTCTIQSGSNYQMGFGVYIDWNQDAVFSNTTEKVVASPNVPIAASFNNYTFTIPASQPNGTYRMRVRCMYFIAGNNPAFDPCNLSSWGESEDYNIIIGSSPPAASPITATAVPNQTICISQNAILGVAYSGTTFPAFDWGGPNSFTSSIQNPTVVNTSTASNGYYYVALTSATCPIMASTHVYIDQGPFVNISTGSTSLCTGSTVTLTATGASNYTWSPIVSNNTVVIVTPSATSIYTLYGIGTGSCAGIKTITLTILPSHTVNITGTPTILCQGSQATLTASGASSYTWSNGPIMPSIVVSPITTTCYTVVGSGTLCSSSSIFTLVVSVCGGLNEIDKEGLAHLLFQNPFHDQLKISSDREVVIVLMDVSGKILLKEKISNEANIETSALPKGIYFLTIEEGLSNKPVKVIKD